MGARLCRKYEVASPFFTHFLYLLTIVSDSPGCKREKKKRKGKVVGEICTYWQPVLREGLLLTPG